MAQFDVHRNPGKNRGSVPYVVVLQSSVFTGYKRRVVAPLVRKSSAPATPHSVLNPTFTISGVQVMLHPLDIATVPVAELGPTITSLARHGDKLVAALDQLFTRAWD